MGVCISVDVGWCKVWCGVQVRTPCSPVAASTRTVRYKDLVCIITSAAVSFRVLMPSNRAR